MKASTLRLCALASVLLPLATAANSFAAAITQIRVYSSSSVGAWDGIDLWDTVPADGNYNLGVYQNLQSLRAGSTDAGASVNIPISSGTSTFELAGAPGVNHPFYDVQLYFDNAPLPQLSVIVPESFPNAVSGSIVGNSLGGMSFSTGGNTYTIQSFEWMAPSVDNIDLVGPFTLGADGIADYVGILTLNVTPQIAAAAPEPASLSLLALGGAALLRRRKR